MELIPKAFIKSEFQFLSANNSLVALYNKFQNQDQIQNDHIEIKMTTGSTDLKFKTQ